jgi:AcrR family transcriptional regulator
MQQEKKECILRAAAKVFSRFGFKKASVEEIARDAGVAKGTIYLAAETKEDLYYQTLLREVRAWQAEISRLVDPRVPADELLEQAAVMGMQYVEERPLVKELLFGNVHLILPDWSDRLDELRKLGRAHTREVLELGVSQGRFRADLDLDEVATLLQDLAIATYVFHNRPGPDRAERLARRLRAAMSLIRTGLLVTSPPAQVAAPDDKAERAGKRAHKRTDARA